MKKAFIAITAMLLIYGFFREFQIVKVLIMAAGLASIYIIYRIPSHVVAAMKYPFIILSFLVTALFFVYPKVPLSQPAQVCIVFLSFYGLIFYLAGMEESKKELFKEITAISILFFSASFNLFMAREILLIAAFALALMLFLFILDRLPMIPLIGGYTLVTLVIAYNHGVNILGNGFAPMGRIDKYILLGSSFALLITSFILFMEKSTFTKMLPFFGLLYIALDILAVLGLKLSTGLLYQPVLFLVLVSPFIGVMLRTEGGRA